MKKVKVVQLCAFDSDVCKRGFSCIVTKKGQVLRDEGIYRVVHWCKRFTMDSLRCVDVVRALESSEVQDVEMSFAV